METCGIRDNNMIKIILDTNFVVIPFEFKVDIYSEFERIIDAKYKLIFPKICEAELEKLKYGKAALKLLKQKNVEFVDISLTKSIDDSILEYAKKEKCIIATQDKELKKKALKEGLSVITLRQKKYLWVVS